MTRKSKRNATYVAGLRGLAWLVVWLSVAQAARNPGPGGIPFGLILAATLAAYLRATRNTKKGRKR